MYMPTIGRFATRDPINEIELGDGGYDHVSGRSKYPTEYDDDPYRYCGNNPLNLTDPLGLDACEINIWAGDTLKSKGSLGSFYDNNTEKNKGGTVCPSKYIGVVGCGFYGPGGPASKLPAIPGIQQIPGFPPDKDFMNGAEVFAALDAALKKAEAFTKQLCKNHEEFCDDGKPERYQCGAKNQRCDSVTISVSYDKYISQLLNKGIAPDGTPVLGLPSPASKALLKELNSLMRHPKTTKCG